MKHSIHSAVLLGEQAGSNPAPVGSTPTGTASQGGPSGEGSGLQSHQAEFDSLPPCSTGGRRGPMPELRERVGDVGPERGGVLQLRVEGQRLRPVGRRDGRRRLMPRVGGWTPACLVSRIRTVRVRGEALYRPSARSACSLTTSTQPSLGTRNAPLAQGNAPLVMRRDATLVKWKAQFDTGRGLCNLPRWSNGDDAVLVRLKSGFDSRVRLCWGTRFGVGSRSASGRRVRLSSPPLSVSRGHSEMGSRHNGIVVVGVQIPVAPLSVVRACGEAGSHRPGVAEVGVRLPPGPLMGSSSSGKTPRSQRGNGGSIPPGSTVWRVAQRQSTSPQEGLLGGFPWGTGRAVQLPPCQLPIHSDRRVLS